MAADVWGLLQLEVVCSLERLKHYLPHRASTNSSAALAKCPSTGRKERARALERNSALPVSASAVWPWASCLVSLSLGFFILSFETTTQGPQACLEDWTGIGLQTTR